MSQAFRPCLILLMAVALASCSGDSVMLPEQEQQTAEQPTLKRPAHTDSIDVSGGDIPIDDDDDDDSTATTGIVLPTV